MLARDAGDTGTRSKCFSQNLKTLRLGPTPAPLRTRKHRDLTQRPLLSTLSRALLRPVSTCPRKTAFTEGVLRTREGMKIARDKGKLRGKPPKLSDLQQRELLKMHATGEYSISDLGKLFKVSRPTVYRTIRRGEAAS